MVAYHCQYGLYLDAEAVFLVLFLIRWEEVITDVGRTILRSDKLHISSLLISLDDGLAILVGFRSDAFIIEP